MSSENSDHARWFMDEVRPHEPTLRAYLRDRFPKLHDVDDVVQESYLALFRKRVQGNLHCVRGLLFTAARNLALDTFRRRQRAPFVELPVDAAPPATDEARSAADEVCHRQELALLAEAVEALPRRAREVLKLRKIYGLSHREIANHLGISERMVNAEVIRGVRLCTEFLQRRGVPLPARGGAR